jgi:hypothetical protein
LFGKSAPASVAPVGCAPCEKHGPVATPKITVIVPPPEVVVRSAPAAAPCGPVCTKGPLCHKAAAPVAAPRPVAAPTYAAPAPVLVPQLSYQMMPVVSMQPVPTMTYGLAAAAPAVPYSAPPPVSYGAVPCAQPPATGCGAPGQFGLGSASRDLDAEISRIKSELTGLNGKLTDLANRVKTNAEWQQNLEERLKATPEGRKLLEK